MPSLAHWAHYERLVAEPELAASMQRERQRQEQTRIAATDFTYNPEP